MTSPRHVPVLLDRVVALLAPALDHDGAVLVDATLGLGGHTEAVLDRLRAGPGDRHRPRPERPRARRRAAGAVRRPVHRRPRRLRRAPRGPRRPRASTRVDAVLFDLGVSSHAARRARARLRLRARTRRSTCGWTAPTGPHRRRRAQHLPGRRADPDPAGVRRGEVRPQDRRAPSSASASASRSRPRPGSSSCCTPRSRRRPGAPAGTRPSAPSRRCGWRSTTSSPCCGGRCRPRSTRSRVGGRVVVESYHSLEDRLVKQAFTAATRSDVPAGPARSCPRAASRRCGWSPAAPRRPTPPRSSDNPRAASVRLRADRTQSAPTGESPA